MPVTPNIGLNTPAIGSNNWGTPLNFNFAQLDRFLSGNATIPGLSVAGNVTVTGSITAGSFSGLGGATFLTSANYDTPNGVPQLNSAGLIPSSLLSNQGIVAVPFTATPVFNAASGGAFKLTLTGAVTSSTFANGAQGPSIVVFRIVQDGAGGHPFVWPGNVRNGGAINPGPNKRTVQLFSLDTDGSLDAFGPPMYS